MKTRQERTAAFEKVDLYPVTDQALSLGRDNYQVAQGIIDGGAKIVQLREKHLSKTDFLVMACRFRELTKKAGILLIINDHIDIAQACGADGVHLGQDDIPLKAARALAPDLIIGASTHNLDEALQAQADGADYVNIGPIFPTATKAVAMDPLTPQAIRDIAPHLTVPFTVMGGINETNIRQVLDAGARRIAVVTAVTRAPDIAGAVRGLIRQINAYP